MLTRPILPASIDTLYVLIVDRSGSMAGLESATVEGINSYVAKQKELGVKNAYLSLYQFDSVLGKGMDLTVTFDMVPLERVRMLGLDDFTPRGGTPLFEAIGQITTMVRDVVESAENPPAVVVQIITDGGNTDWIEHTAESVAAMIHNLEDNVKGWTFTYAGANQNAAAVSGEMGISTGNTIQYATAKTGNTFEAMATASAMYATTNSIMRSTDKKARFTTKSIYDDAKVETTHLG